MSSQEKAIQIEQAGGPEMMHLVDVEVGEPSPGEVRIRHQACGLNYIDIYQLSGVYALPLPLRLGRELASTPESPHRAPRSPKPTCSLTVPRPPLMVRARGRRASVGSWGCGVT